MNFLYFYQIDPITGSKTAHSFESAAQFMTYFNALPLENRTLTEFLKVNAPRKIFFRYRLGKEKENPITDINEALINILKKNWNKELTSEQILYSSFKFDDNIIYDVILFSYSVDNFRQLGYFATQLNEVLPILQMDYSIYKINQEILFPTCYLPPFTNRSSEKCYKEINLEQTSMSNYIVSSVAECERLIEISFEKN